MHNARASREKFLSSYPSWLAAGFAVAAGRICRVTAFFSKLGPRRCCALFRHAGTVDQTELPIDVRGGREETWRRKQEQSRISNMMLFLLLFFFSPPLLSFNFVPYHNTSRCQGQLPGGIFRLAVSIVRPDVIPRISQVAVHHYRRHQMFCQEGIYLAQSIDSGGCRPRCGQRSARPYTQRSGKGFRADSSIT